MPGVYGSGIGLGTKPSASTQFVSIHPTIGLSLASYLYTSGFAYAKVYTQKASPWYTYIYIHIYVYLLISIDIYIYIQCVYDYTAVYICKHTHLAIVVSLCVCTHIYIYIYEDTSVYICLHIYIYIRILKVYILTYAK